MKKILFVQGGGNDGYEADKKLVNSLTDNLEEGYDIDYPEIQSVETEPDYGWVRQIRREILKRDDGLFLIGHSFGASMILKCLSENLVEKNFGGLFLIAPPFWKGEEDWVQGLKLQKKFGKTLPENMPIFLYHCRDDDEVSFQDALLYKKALPRATFRELETGGHQMNNDLALVAKDIKSLKPSVHN